MHWVDGSMSRSAVPGAHDSHDTAPSALYIPTVHTSRAAVDAPTGDAGTLARATVGAFGADAGDVVSSQTVVAPCIPVHGGSACARVEAAVAVVGGVVHEATLEGTAVGVAQSRVHL
jgi:hypothetical protein